jgi:hypothetical protein
MRAHPAFRDAVRAAMWSIAGATIGILTVLVGAYVGGLHHHRWIAFICGPLLLLSYYFGLMRLKRDDTAVQAIGGDARRVRTLAERDAYRHILRLRRLA